MTSETDLHSAIDELAAEAKPAPFVDRVVEAAAEPGVSVRRRWSRHVLPLAAAAAVVAVAVGLAVALRPADDRTASDSVVPTSTLQCATSRTPSFVTFSVGPVAGVEGLNTNNATTCAGYQSQSYFTNASSITIYRQGVFNLGLLGNSRAVHGRGISGFYLPSLRDGHGRCAIDLAAKTCTAPPGLAWEYKPGAWATITANPMPPTKDAAKVAAELLAVAAAVHPDSALALITPFRVSDLAGLQPLTAMGGTKSPHPYDVGEAGATLQLAVPGSGSGCPAHAACTDDVSVSVLSTVDPPGSSLGDFTGQPVTIGRSTGLLISAKRGEPRELRFQVNHWVTIITVDDPNSSVTNDQLVRIARSMTFAQSTTDSGTWFQFDHALPSR